MFVHQDYEFDSYTWLAYSYKIINNLENVCVVGVSGNSGVSVVIAISPSDFSAVVMGRVSSVDDGVVAEDSAIVACGTVVVSWVGDGTVDEGVVVAGCVGNNDHESDEGVVEEEVVVVVDSGVIDCSIDDVVGVVAIWVVVIGSVVIDASVAGVVISGVVVVIGSVV